MRGLHVTYEWIRMGELEPWMDENFIKGVFLSSAGETVNVKVIRDKNSG